MSNHAHRPSLIVCTTAAAVLAVWGQARAQLGPALPVALSGSTQTGPYGPNLLDSLGDPQYFTGFGGGAVLSRTGGHAVFSANTNVVFGALGTFQSGIWLWNGSNTNVVKYTDNPALGGVGTYSTSGVASFLAVSGGGQFAFRDGTGASGVLYTTSGTPGRLLMAGDTALDTGGATFASPANLMNINASGSVATLATLAGGTGSPAVVTAGTMPYPNQMGFWAGTPGALHLLVRMGDQLNTPGNVAIPDVLVGTIDTSSYSYSDSGKLLWTGAMEGAAVNTNASSLIGTNQGLMSTRHGFAEVIARRGDSFPDSTGATFTSGTATDGVAYRAITTSNGMDMNSAGHVVYSATLRTSAGAAPTTNGTAALFSDNTGTLRTIARETFLVPPSLQNAAGDMRWGNSFPQAIINGADTIVFSVTGLTGTGLVNNVNNAGVYRVDSAGNYTKVFQMGDSAPASPAVSGNPAPGQVIPGANPTFSSAQQSYIMNASGQMAFSANGVNLSGTGIVSGQGGNATGLFAVDTDGTIYLVAQKGMLFHVGPGDDRVVSGVSGGIGLSNTGGGQDGRTTTLDDNGNLLFNLIFTDPAAVPPPGATVGSYGIFIVNISATGACCNSGTGACTLTSTLTACTNQSGAYQGKGSVCTPSPCPQPTGACCRGATCSVVAQAACTVSGGTAGAVFTGAGNACGTATAPCCYANYNKTGGLSVQDIFDFLNDWFAGSLYSIPGGNGVTGTLAVQNIFDFINAWFAGGCS